jgi:hypothetical protein
MSMSTAARLALITVASETALQLALTSCSPPPLGHATQNTQRSLEFRMAVQPRGRQRTRGSQDEVWYSAN